MAVAKQVANKPGTVKFTIDCGVAEKDNILDAKDLEQFLHSHIKVDGKTGNFEKVDRATGETTRFVTVSHDNQTVIVEAMLPFPKHYLKYLTKKFLNSFQLRDFLRVVASDKNSYELRYYRSVQEGVQAK